MQPIRLLISLFAFLISNSALSQDSTAYAAIPKIPSQYFEAVSKKATTLQENIDKKSQKVLARMQKAEGRLQKKLAKIDSLTANNVFKDAENKYTQLKEKLNEPQSLSRYVPRLDTLITSIKFLKQNQDLLNNVKDAKEKLDEASGKLKELQNKLQNAEDIKQFLKSRQEYLTQQLKKFAFAKQLKRINKDVYYFGQSISEIKATMQDSKKVERKALELLSKTRLWKDFMRKNSLLASLFRMPGDPNDPTSQISLAGLQTRASVNALIQNQIAAGGPNAQQAFQQQIQQAQSQIQQLKDKVNKLGGGSSDDIMPDGFKPSQNKTKSFLQRLEIGTNVQSQRGNGLIPTRSDVGISIGYRLNDRSVAGIGGSYRIAWGNGWNDIRISGAGQSLRSFIDWKIKGSFWISGGFEMNHYPALNGVSIQTRAGVFNADQLQRSGLLGISKVVSVKSKLFKKTKAALLWDFLSYQQIPKAQPILFRVGYSFK